jgi:hypothetical protein
MKPRRSWAAIEKIVPVLEHQVGAVSLGEEMLVGDLALEGEERRERAGPLATLLVEFHVGRGALLSDHRVLDSPDLGLPMVRSGIVGLAGCPEDFVRVAARLFYDLIGDALRASIAAVDLAIALVAFLAQALIGVLAMGAARRGIHAPNKPPSLRDQETRGLLRPSPQRACVRSLTEARTHGAPVITHRMDDAAWYRPLLLDALE